MEGCLSMCPARTGCVRLYCTQFCCCWYRQEHSFVFISGCWEIRYVQFIFSSIICIQDFTAVSAAYISAVKSSLILLSRSSVTLSQISLISVQRFSCESLTDTQSYFRSKTLQEWIRDFSINNQNCSRVSTQERVKAIRLMFSIGKWSTVAFL